MEEQNAIGPLLNELITINKNRIIGYKQALHPDTLHDIGAPALFKEMIRQSEVYIDQLEESIKQIGGNKKDKTSTSGLLYNIWTDILYTESEKPKPDTKSFCIQLEETTLNAYNAVADKNPEIPRNISQMITSQKKEIEHALEQVKER